VGQFIMVAWMVVLFLIIVGLVFRFDPEARGPVTSGRAAVAAPDATDGGVQ
jgi:hypothetical protein